MVRKRLFNIFSIIIFLFTLVCWSASEPVWAGHDEGLGKSQDPGPDISIAPEPSGLLLFTVGGMLVAYRCRKKKKV